MSVRIYTGDCRTELAKLPKRSVHCCVTSPPYWALRDYGTEPVVWGGDADCEHRWCDGIVKDNRSAAHLNVGLRDDPARSPRGGKQLADQQPSQISQGQFCCKCNAWRGSLGLEPTPDLYIEHVVEVFRAVRRVLRDDGTVWLNLGDSYAAGKNGRSDDGPADLARRAAKYGTGTVKSVGGAVQRKAPPGLKAKDLCMMPARVALELQADGWWLRSEIIWHKPNPMPESVTDRPTSAHEKVYLLSKRARYFYDAEAVAEPALQPLGLASEVAQHKQEIMGQNRGGKLGTNAGSGLRNLRDVWTIATAPYSGAHFATFPPALAERCIKAGCPTDGTVLDPFGGAGTTGLVADRLGRNAVLIDLNPEYAGMAQERTAQDAGLFADVVMHG